MEDTGQPVRAGFWRRFIAVNIVDFGAVTLALALIGLILFLPTGGRIRVANMLINTTTCAQVDPSTLTGFSLPSNFRPTLAAKCTRSLLGYVHDRFLTVVERTQSGSVTYTRSFQFALDSGSEPTSAFYVDYLFILILLPYLVIAEWRWGKTLGKDILDIRVQSVGGGPLTIAQATKRTVARFWFVVLQLIAVIWLDADAALSFLNYGLVLVVLMAAIVLAQGINFIVAVRRRELPWHDRWAKTEVVRGR